jgi:glucose-6-phosphate isomerase
MACYTTLTEAIMTSAMKFSLGNELKAAFKRALDDAASNQVVRRIWQHDPLLWKSDSAQQQIIQKSLDWLTAADEMITAVDDLSQFADEVRSSGFKHVMVCGMGGSSLCPEVLAKTFGPQSSYPELLVLDSTDPDVIADLATRIDLSRSLFIISSKSGTTTEPLVFYKYWYDQVSRAKQNPGGSFVVITDPGTPLVDEAREKGFRRVFLNQPHIGGRYSALSYFGMVPAALMGLDLKKLLRSAREMSRKCGPDTPASDNPGAELGAVIAECANAGRDKLTLITDPRLRTLGLWIEQLIAESTGKEGKGILPVDGEPLGLPDKYSSDRTFVFTGLPGGNEETVSRLIELESMGHPVVYRTLDEEYDLGAEFFLWEFATAFAGWRLGINPFDQPNVQESKDATRTLLQFFSVNGALPEQTRIVSEEGLTIFADEKMRSVLPVTSVADALRVHLASVRPGDYVALLNYIEETPLAEQTIERIRSYLRDATHCATTAGYGPRFLHSTGQLHKGGPDTGVFIQITAPDKHEIPVPGENYSFSILKQAQALGDFQALSSRGRRAIRVDLGSDSEGGLVKFESLIRQNVV